MVWRARGRRRTTGMSYAGGATGMLRPAGMSATADRQALADPLDVGSSEKIATTKGAQRGKDAGTIKFSLLKLATIGYNVKANR